MLLHYIIWDINPVVFKIGTLSLRWYSILMAFGFFMGYLLIRRIFKLEGVPVKTLESFGIYIVLGMFIGGRLGHCLFYDPEYYLQFPLDIIKPWRGELGNGAVFTGYKGMASHGGIVGVLIGLSINARIKKLPILWVFDRFAIVVALAGFFIRLGNLFNSEILGLEASVPWAIIFARVSNTPKHPAQIYEAIAYLFTFFICWKYYLKNREKLINGELLGLAMLFVFISRFFFEFIKEGQTISDSYSFLKMGQLLSIPFIVIGGGLFLYQKYFAVGKAR